MIVQKLSFISIYDYRLQELLNARQVEKQYLQSVERKATDERRMRQSLESHLYNERKQRRAAVEKASR